MKKSLLLITLLLGACMPPAADKPSDTVSVVATFYPLAFIAEQVGGDRVDVRQIVPTGVEPHEYEPTPQDLIAVSGADVFLYNGLGLDPWAERIAADLRAKNVVAIEATASAALLPATENDEHEEEEESAFDPHLWQDPVFMQRIAEAVHIALTTRDAAGKDIYQQNADQLRTALDALDKEYAQGLKQCAVREIITSHNAFQYLAKRYGFTIHSIAGLSPNDDPSPLHMAELASLAKEKDIRVIFFETLANPRLSQTIADEIGAETAVLNPIEGLTPDEVAQGKDYTALMKENLTQLRKAMRCA